MPNRAERRKALQEAYCLAKKASAPTTPIPLESMPEPVISAVAAEPSGSPSLPTTILPTNWLFLPRRICVWLVALWRWAGGRWQWGSVFGGACTMIKLGEYGIGWFLFALAAFAASSRIAYWNDPENPRRTRKVRPFGHALVGVAFVFLTVVTFSVKGDDPWSHLLTSRRRGGQSTGTLVPSTVLSAKAGIVPTIEIGSSGVIFTKSIPGGSVRPELEI